MRLINTLTYLLISFLWQFYGITFAKEEGLECYKDTQMKADDIATLAAEVAELKSDNVQNRNKIIYIAVVLFWWRRSIATGCTALAPYLELLGVGELPFAL